jgi:hypothetical protein
MHFAWLSDERGISVDLSSRESLLGKGVKAWAWKNECISLEEAERMFKDEPRLCIKSECAMEFQFGNHLGIPNN